MMILKYIAPLVLSALMLAACGKSESSSGTSSPEPASAAESAPQSSEATASQPAPAPSLSGLAAEVKATDAKTFTGSVSFGDPLFDKNCKKLYRCELSELTDGFIVFNENGGLSDEVSIIRRADGDTAKAEQQLTERRQIRYDDFEGYVPEELPKIEAGRVFTVGGYTVLIISNNADALEKLVREKLEVTE